MFLIHGVDGDVLRFEELARSLDADQPVYGVRSQALLGERRAFTRVEDMAAYYLADVKRVQERGPYHFAGFSFGALVAFEMARQLCAHGETVGMLALLDHRRMTSALTLSRPSGADNRAAQATPRADSHLQRLLAPGGLAYAREKVRGRSFRLLYTLLDAIQQPVPRVLQNAYEINWFAGVRYVPGPYPGRILLFHTPETIEQGSGMDWENLAGAGVEVHRIAGSHGDLLTGPYIPALAAQLTQCLDAIHRRTLAP